MRVVRFPELSWTSAPMQDSSGDVALALLPQLADGAFRAFVRFPPGWVRAVGGAYEAAEEILVLEGALKMNGETWGEGAHVWAPGGCARFHTAAPRGCLAFAWFEAPPRWRHGQVEGPSPAGLPHWREGARRTAPFGGEWHRLRSGPAHESWLAPDGCAGRAEGTVEWLALDDRRWGVGEIDERLDIAGPTFLRLLP